MSFYKANFTLTLFSAFLLSQLSNCTQKNASKKTVSQNIKRPTKADRKLTPKESFLEAFSHYLKEEAKKHKKRITSFKLINFEESGKNTWKLEYELNHKDLDNQAEYRYHANAVVRIVDGNWKLEITKTLRHDILISTGRELSL